MKSKKFNVKLFLNKKTIADIDANEMSQVKGGTGTYRPTCTLITVKVTCTCTEWFSCPATAC